MLDARLPLPPDPPLAGPERCNRDRTELTSKSENVVEMSDGVESCESCEDDLVRAEAG